MSSSSSEPSATTTTVPLTPGGADEENHFTPKLMVSVVGCLVGFIFIFIGFRLVSRRNWRTGGNSDRLPQYTPRRGAPVVDRSRCRLCPFSRRKTSEGLSMSRIPIPSPPPTYAHALSSPAFPTTTASAAPPPLSWLPGSGTFAARAESADATPSFPPPAYFIAIRPGSPIASLNRDRR
ncbi:hypothetical protein L226DRAFT_615415 [Lentinus tigrinus ALCF2SS1-7]|uniref:Uncharacterized protein n=1 Tax=Lentinus tigrinus ALCF2SS1-6 TaxID=1328759 RepID=A0A5C2S019_9APHY|nr:hypothetical protein L227DRAFT_655988 [Lentinus tigrinus ALCF2SS1-6]RPD71669.1 hypothetical protein L226DRAFT_615415 [Lentinus tigrinus ALCF2SS1-7]